jgi:hypothetical protein
MVIFASMRTCRFCLNDTSYVPIEITETRALHIYHCYICNVEYVYWADNEELGSQHIYTTIDKKTYRWTFPAPFSSKFSGMVATSPNEGRLWHVGKPGIPGIIPNRNVQLLRIFQVTVPEITPINVHSVIRMILTFI